MSTTRNWRATIMGKNLKLLLHAAYLLPTIPIDGFVFRSSASKQQRTFTELSTASASSSSPSFSSSHAQLGSPVCSYHTITIPTSQSGPPRQMITVEDLTPTLNSLLESSKLNSGTITIISRHTTTAITINERESRLAKDMAEYFLSLAPIDERSVAADPNTSKGVRYQHNDIDLRPEGDEEFERCLDNGWDVTKPDILERWRAQEPINAHSHLLSMLIGSSESIPVVEGKMVIGQWQSVLLVDLDGPRERTVGIQMMGFQ